MPTEIVIPGRKKSPVAELFFARRELGKSLRDILFSMVLPFAAYFAIIVMSDTVHQEDVEFFPSEEVFALLLKVFFFLCWTDFVCKVFCHRQLITLKRKDIACILPCHCKQKSQQRLLFMEHTIEYVSEDCGRIEIACPHCHKAILTHTIHEEGLFEFILK